MLLKNYVLYKIIEFNIIAFTLKDNLLLESKLACFSIL